MKTLKEVLNESLLDDDILDKVDDMIDIYKSSIKFIDSLNFNAGLYIIYTILDMAAFTNFPIDKTLNMIMTYYSAHKNLDDFMSDPKMFPIIGFIKFIYSLKNYIWFKSANRNEISLSTLKPQHIYTTPTKEEYEEMTQFYMYAPKRNHIDSFLIDTGGCYNPEYYLIRIDKRMNKDEKKVLHHLMSKVVKK